MRKSGIITLLVIVALFFAISIILSDAFFESAIEDFGSDMVGAKVEIDGFNLSLLNPGIRWQRLQVTDPKKTMKNMIETGFTEFRMEFWPLFSGKVIIENVQLSDLKTNTDRETDGALPKKPKGKKAAKGIAKAKEGLNNEMEKLPAFNILSSAANINVDSIVSILNLQSPAKIDSARTLIESTYAKWEQKINSSDPDKDLQKIKQQIEAIDIKKINSLKSFKNALSSVKTLQDSIDSLTDNYKKIKNDFNADYSGSGNALSQIDNWIKEDYSRAMNQAKLPDMSAQNIGKMLFGKEIVNQVNEYLGYVGTARGYMDKIPSGAKKEPDPPRFKGQDIYFASKNARPDFWLKQLALSGYLSDEMPLSGKVSDISSNPKMIGRPTEINIAGSSKNSQSYGLTGTLNYLDSIPKENFNLEYKGFSISGMKLSQSELLPQSVKKGNGVLNSSLNLAGDFINGEINFSSANVEFGFNSNPEGKFQSIIRDVFLRTRELTFKAKIKGKMNDLVFSVKTNLDEKITEAFKATASKEIEQAKQKIREKIDKQVGQKKAEAEKLIAENKQKLEAKLDQYKEKIDEQKKQLDKHKEKIENEKKNLGKQVKDKLKDLF